MCVVLVLARELIHLPFSQSTTMAETQAGHETQTLEEPVQLENSWCFWHDKYLGPAQSVEEYEASLQKLCTFSTIQVCAGTFSAMVSSSHGRVTGLLEKL